MIRPRFSFGATFLRNKAYAFVAGGYSTAMQAIPNCELYNVSTNKWMEIQGSMQKARTAHSLCEVAGGKFIYAFGGMELKGQTEKSLDSIERIAVGTGNDLETSIMSAQWELLNDIKLPMPLSNIGCYPLSQGEVLLFGGITNGAKQSWGKVMMVMGGSSHSFLPGTIGLSKGDVFSNTTQVTVLEKGHDHYALI